jgi:hypothetical protein
MASSGIEIKTSDLVTALIRSLKFAVSLLEKLKKGEKV